MTATPDAGPDDADDASADFRLRLASIAMLTIAACGRAPAAEIPRTPAAEPRPTATANRARAGQPVPATADAGADAAGADAADDAGADANTDAADATPAVHDQAEEGSEVDDSVCPETHRPVAGIVRQLGTNRDAAPFCSVRHLHVHGRAAVPLLVRQLLVLRPDTPWDTELHVIWCVRALRSITGQKFQFSHRAKMVRRYNCLPSPRKCPGRLVKNTGEPMPFFEEGMSRPQIYLSPPDVRWRVIQAWKTWVNKNGRTFTVQEYDGIGDWFW